MRSAIFKSVFARSLLALSMIVIARSALAADDGSAEMAINVFHAANKQAEAAVAGVRSGKHDQTASDKAYEATFNSAVWEGLKLADPASTVERRKRISDFIGSGKMFYSTAKGAAIGEYLFLGVKLNDALMRQIDSDADDAFRLGYAQAVKRDETIKSLK